MPNKWLVRAGNYGILCGQTRLVRTRQFTAAPAYLRPEYFADMTAFTSPLIACHECDLLQREVSLAPGETALCRRCGGILYRNAPDSLNRTLAFSLAAAILFVIANIFPIIGIDSDYADPWVMPTPRWITLPGKGSGLGRSA